MKIKLILLILMLAISINTTSATLTYAGIRDSIYGCPESDNCQTLHNPFYINVAKQMAAKFPGSIPTAIYIIGQLDTPETYTYLNFPSPDGTHNYVRFETTDGNEANLDAMDTQGLDYWLQVEPGDASMTDLMALVFGRYGTNHAGHIIGFGIDAEWYRSTHATEGQVVSNSDVNSWINYVHNYDAYCVGGSCRLFLKHFDKSHMPSTHPAGVLLYPLHKPW
jgi:hypothetical protein